MKEKQKLMIENYVNSYNEFDVNGMIKDLAPDILFVNISNGNIGLRTEGLAAFVEQAEAAKQYFKQRKQTIEAWKFIDSKVSITIDYEAILAIDLPNGLKAGDTLKLNGSSDFEFENGKIKSITDHS